MDSDPAHIAVGHHTFQDFYLDRFSQDLFPDALVESRSTVAVLRGQGRVGTDLVPHPGAVTVQPPLLQGVFFLKICPQVA